MKLHSNKKKTADDASFIINLRMERFLCIYIRANFISGIKKIKVETGRNIHIHNVNATIARIYKGYVFSLTLFISNL